MLDLLKFNHYNIYLLGLSMMIIGLPFSNFLMSLSQVILVLNWLVEGDFRIKWNLFISNSVAKIVASIYLLYIVGLLHSSDFSYALDELRIKLPILILPIIFSTTKPLANSIVGKLLSLFVAAVFAGTLCSLSEYLGLNNLIRSSLGIPVVSLLDIREISLFVSHIRFSLMICFSVCFLFYRTFLRESSFNEKLIFNIIALWFVVFLFLFESVTGFAILLVIGILSISYIAFQKCKRIWFWVYLSSVLLLFSFSVYALFGIVNDYKNVPLVDTTTLDKLTSEGNPYVHDTLDTQLENGNYIWMYQCKKELEEQWNSKSNIDYKGLDEKGQEIEYTLIRFLTSKGLRKDADGFRKLTDDEIKAIENGVANVYEINKFNIISRLNRIYWEIDDYQRGGNPSGHSVVQRLEYWIAAMYVIKNNPFVGVGTGDVMISMNNAYEMNSSKLDLKYRKRPHNQFLSVFIGFGAIGFFWFLLVLFYPLKNISNNLFQVLYCCFLIIAVLSMLTEDTLDTQAGVSFFAFLNSFLLFVPNMRNAD